MKVAFVGLGYVGLTTAVVLASRGIQVVGVDVNSEKVQKINSGEPPFYEPQVPELLRKSLELGTFSAHDSYDALKDADIIFITVGTPSREDGSINLDYIRSAAESIGRAIKGSGKYQVIAVKSTVVPGTTRNVVGKILEESSGRKLGEDIGLCSNPEFLREGKAVSDTLNADKVVIGEYDRRSGDVLYDFWRKFYSGKDVKFLRTTLENAELIKYAINSFLATKISFINMLANICERIPHCDVGTIAKGMGLDWRINPAFLGAGLGFGGSCFPKDVKALTKFSESLGYEPLILKATLEINERQPLRAVEILEELIGDVRGKRIALLGLAFKPNTDDIREAVSLKIIRRLLELGAEVVAYDPRAMDNVRGVFGDRIEYAGSAEDALRGADGAILVTEWDEFKKLAPETFAKLMRNPALVDGRRVYVARAEDFKKAGVAYRAIGLSPEG